METVNKESARYKQIALMLAGDISRGVYGEGQKLSGRSILAGKYAVSSETIRKALSLLQEQSVVETVPGSGVLIVSRQAAQDFVTGFQQHGTLDDMVNRLNELTRQRSSINQQIDRLLREILGYKRNLLKSMQNTADITVAAGSPLVGQSIQEACLRSVTGATIIAVHRKGRWHISPGQELLLAPGDMLMVAGHQNALTLLRQLAVESGSQNITGDE